MMAMAPKPAPAAIPAGPNAAMAEPSGPIWLVSPMAETRTSFAAAFSAKRLLEAGCPASSIFLSDFSPDSRSLQLGLDLAALHNGKAYGEIAFRHGDPERNVVLIQWVTLLLFSKRKCRMFACTDCRILAC
jgi:hypothetical protein